METGPGALIGSGRVADVHVFGEHAVKLYHAGQPATDAFLEAAALALVATHDAVPAPKVHRVARFDNRWGIVMDRVVGAPLGRAVLTAPALAPAALDEMARLHATVHGCVETRLRRQKARLARDIARAPVLGAPLKQALSNRLDALPDGDRLCHGDFHPLNLLGEPGHCVIVDWLDATSGTPAADACRSYLLLKLAAPPLAEPYLDRYVRRTGSDRAAILDWLPCIAAARLSEGIENEQSILVEMAEAT